MPGFWVEDDDKNPVHINGDPNMSPETLAAIMAVVSKIKAKYNRHWKSFEHVWEHQTSVTHKEEVAKDEAWYWFELGCSLMEQREINREQDRRKIGKEGNSKVLD